FADTLAKGVVPILCQRRSGAGRSNKPIATVVVKLNITNAGAIATGVILIQGHPRFSQTMAPRLVAVGAGFQQIAARTTQGQQAIADRVVLVMQLCRAPGVGAMGLLQAMQIVIDEAL